MIIFLNIISNLFFYPQLNKNFLMQDFKYINTCKRNAYIYIYINLC